MSANGEPDPLDVAFQAALAARRETFLARLPRLLKLAVLALLLMGLGACAWLAADAARARHEAQTPKVEAHAEKAVPESHAHDAGEKEPAAAAPMESPAAIEPKTDAQRYAVHSNDQALGDSGALPPAPDVELAEEAQGGYLPKIGADGRKPWQVYARPFDRQDPRPRIALVVGDLGLSRVATDAALRRLPSPVTLAFDAQGDSVAAWLSRARQDGHETLLALPMEPLDYPHSDPGPGSLLTTLPNSDNLQRLNGFLKEGVGYVGVTTLSGSRFVADKAKIQPIIEALRARGLLVLDTRVAAHSVVRALALEAKVPVAVSARAIDSEPTPQAIDAALAALEQAARRDGQAVAMASPLPVTLERIEAWAKTLTSRGLVLAPVSAVVE